MRSRFLVKLTLVTVVISLIVFLYTLKASKAISYFSSDPKACINCHVMNSAYATWQHSSHFKIKCVQCHLPTHSTLQKYFAKMKDGFNHSVAFTTNDYDHSIKISKDGALRVQKNCISCHSSLVSNVKGNRGTYHSVNLSNGNEQRKCWACHRTVPHGTVRSLITAPYNLGVKEIK